MKITEHVHAIKIPFQVKTGLGTLERFVYVYLICGKKICLIDSGVASSKEVIREYMIKNGLNISDISLMILTHSHPDHIGSAKPIQETCSCEVLAHEMERSWIENIELQYHERPVPNFHSLVEGSIKVDHILEDGDVVKLGENIQIEIIHTPGHSSGSISLFIPQERVLITGDAVPLKGDLPIYEDYMDSLRSLERLRAIENVEVLLSSWDDPQRGSKVYKKIDEGLNYLQHIHEVVMKIINDNPSLETIELSKLVLKDLGLPEQAANPIVARSFIANLNEISKSYK